MSQKISETTMKAIKQSYQCRMIKQRKYNCKSHISLLRKIVKLDKDGYETTKIWHTGKFRLEAISNEKAYSRSYLAGYLCSLFRDRIHLEMRFMSNGVYVS